MKKSILLSGPNRFSVRPSYLLYLKIGNENAGSLSEVFDRVIERQSSGLDEGSSELDEESSGLEEESSGLEKESSGSDEDSSGFDEKRKLFSDGTPLHSLQYIKHNQAGSGTC